MTTNSVENILREEDIEGLIQLGAPADEYNPEAREIAAAMSRLGGEASEEQVVQVVGDVWKEFFDLSPEDIEARGEAFLRVAHRLVHEVHQ
jgi:hypothetical protein